MHQGSSRPRRAPGTILLIEDDALVRETLEVALHTFGYRVITAADGHEGLQRALSMPEIDLVLCDLSMPVMGGEGFLRLLRQRDPGFLARVPVFLISADDRAPGLAEEKEVGFLMKPIVMEELLDALALSGQLPRVS